MATSAETPQKQYVDFDEYIDFQLQKTRSHIKWTDVLTALAGVLAFLLGYVLVFTLLDQWVVAGGFGPLARTLMFAVVVLASVAWISWRVVYPYMKRVSRLYAAREIEKAHPELESTLLNLVDLERANHPVAEHVRAALEKRAAVSLSRMDVEQVVDRRNLMRASYALLAAVVLVCLYTLFSPKKISFARPLLPAADIRVPTETEIVSVQPGDTDVVARSHLEVVAEIRGKTPEQVTLYYSTADRKFVDEPVEMRENQPGQRQYRTVLNGESGRGILQEMSYRIEAGDARSRDYRVGVIQPPSATVQQVRFEYPSYMQLPAETRAGGNIDTWEGAEVTLSATTNMPVTSAVVLFSDTEDRTTRAEEVPVRITNGTQLSAKWTLAFRSDGTFPRFYRIACKNAKGESDPEPALYSINIRPDQAPDVTLVDPVTDLERPANAVIPLLVQARDPDFQLRTLQLHVEKEGEEIAAPYLFEGLRQAVSTRYEWDLRPLGLTPGETITFWIEGRDNRQPLGNSKNTPRLNVRILDSSSPEEVERQLAADRERQDEMLAQKGRGDDPEQDQLAQNDFPQQPGDGDAAEGAAENQGENQGEPQKAGDARDGDGTGQEGQTGKSAEAGEGEGEKSQEPGYSPDGGDDAEVLRKLIERQQADQAPDEGRDESQPPDPNADANDGSNGENKSQGKQKSSGKRSDGGSGGERQQPQQKGGRTDTPAENSEQRQPGDQPRNIDERPSDSGGSEQAEGGAPGGEQSERPGDQSGKREQTEPERNQKGGRSDGERGGEGESAGDEQRGASGQSKDQPGKGSGQNKEEGSQPGASDGQEGDQSGQPSGQNKTEPGASSGKAQSEPGAKKPGEPVEPGDSANAQRTDNPPEGKAEPAGKKASGERGQKSAGERKSDGERSGSREGAGSKKTEQSGDAASKDATPEGRGQQSEERAEESAGGDQKAGERSRENQKEAAGSEGDGSSKPSPQPKQNLPEGVRPSDLKKFDENAPESESGGEAQNTQPPEGATPPNAEGSPEGSKQAQGNAPEGEQRPGEGNQQPGEGGQKTGGEQGANKSAGQSGGEQKPGAGGQAGDNSSPTDQAGEQSDSPGRGQARGNQPAGNMGPRNGGERARGDGTSAPPPEYQTEDPNLEFKKRATNLVLEKLGKDLERGEVDEELLKELGWTEEELKKFVDRISRQMNDAGDDNSPEAEARRRQFEWMLRTLDVTAPESRREGTSERDRSTEGISTRRLPVPSEYREAWEAYTRELSRRANPSGPSDSRQKPKGE